MHVGYVAQPLLAEPCVQVMSRAPQEARQALGATAYLRDRSRPLVVACHVAGGHPTLRA